MTFPSPSTSKKPCYNLGAMHILGQFFLNQKAISKFKVLIYLQHTPGEMVK